jgi:glycogen debranching enzyme
MRNEIIEQCKDKAIELLKANSREEGLLASRDYKRSKDRNYVSIFARDIGICSLGMVLSGDKSLIKTVKDGLFTLAKHQAENGQIPNFVRPEPFRVDFWRIDCIDSTLWWLYALKFYDAHSGEEEISDGLKKEINMALTWLKCREHQEDKLLVQNEAADWADIMPRSGKVLYSNALWYKIKILYGLKDAEETKKYFNIIFKPDTADIHDVPHCQLNTYKLAIKKKQDHYLSFVNYYYFGNDADVFGNSLAMLFGLSDSEIDKRIIGNFLKKQNKKFPIPSMFNPIKKGDMLWRPYMNNHNQDRPNQYHNGGIWPFICCFWAIVLAKAGRREEAEKELIRAAELNKINKWQFNEWFHGKTGKPMGMAGQSWNAGMFLAAYFCLNDEDVKL